MAESPFEIFARQAQQLVDVAGYRSIELGLVVARVERGPVALSFRGTFLRAEPPAGSTGSRPARSGR